MPRPYEAVYVFDSTLDDTAITDRLARYAELLGSPADLNVEHWGRRQLAYNIGTRDTGYYAVAHFSAESNVLPEYERALKLDEGIMRYLITLHEHEVGAPPMSEEELARQKAREEDDEEEE